MNIKRLAQRNDLRRRVPMRNLLLRTLAVAGGLSVALIAPKMTRLLKELDRPAKSRAQLYRRIHQAFCGASKMPVS